LVVSATIWGYRLAVSFEPDRGHHKRGEVAAEISTRFVQLVKEHAGRGPTKCRTYIDDDLVIVLMRGGFTRLENTLFEDGKFLDVRTMRHAFQDTMQGRFTEVIERFTGREVAAFMSASHLRPDLQMRSSSSIPDPQVAAARRIPVIRVARGYRDPEGRPVDQGSIRNGQ
jgi:uncharacterized protein YbcI